MQLTEREYDLLDWITRNGPALGDLDDPGLKKLLAEGFIALHPSGRGYVITEKGAAYTGR